MATRLDEFGVDAEDDDEGVTSEESTSSGEPADASPTGDTKEAASGEDDLRTWQSKADKEAARANKLQKELDALRATQAAGGTAPPPAPARDGEDPWVAASKNNFREDLYRSDPRFAQLGLDPSLIQGVTPGEMKQSFESLVGTVDRMTSSIRGQILVEHGLEPEVGGGERATAMNYGTMPKKDFDELVERALGG